jgi:hypothetical protein
VLRNLNDGRISRQPETADLDHCQAKASYILAPDSNPCRAESAFGRDGRKRAVVSRNHGRWTPGNACATLGTNHEHCDAIAEEAYIYGYSLMTTEVTRVQMTNVLKVEGLTGPMGEFINVRRYPRADYRGVAAPNADTLYSVGWMDLAEPQVFSRPDMGSRYYLFEVTDLWMTDSKSSPSKRTADGKAADYLFTGPGWNAEVPAGMKHFPIATRYVVIIGRAYADGTEHDYEAVNALQAQYKITPLSGWGKPYTLVVPPVNPNPGFSMTDKPQTVLLAMGTEGYFNLMAKLMGSDAPPPPEDAPAACALRFHRLRTRQTVRAI